MRPLLLIVVLWTASAASGAELREAWRTALDRITANSLRAHVSFLASDALRGRDTPSPGLDAAAAYIASWFRRAELEPGGDDGYFQTAEWVRRTQNRDGMELAVATGSRIVRAAPAHLAARVAEPLVLSEEPATVATLEKAANLAPSEVDGRVVAVLIPAMEGLDDGERRGIHGAFSRFARMMENREPSLVLYADPGGAFLRRIAQPRLIDPENATIAGAPAMVVMDPAVDSALREAGAGLRVSARCGGPVDEETSLHNVVAILRGSDPELRETAVLLTAHYDHVGVGAPDEPDHIFNGANDDASGTASVLEIASALAAMEDRPRRSVVFMAYFGEEKGLLGSKYYARRPVFPLERTVANVNLEQVGRTDSSEGPQLKNASVTGMDYSEVGSLLREAGAATGIEVFQHASNSDPYFRAADNISLAVRGVPAHTVSTTYHFPDYHGAGDHWDKIDYENMAAVTRMIAAGVLLIAEREQAPRWAEDNEKAKAFREAWDELMERSKAMGAGGK